MNRYLGKMNNFNKKSGFTLVEILVAIFILGLVAMLAGGFINFSFSAERKVEAEYDLQSEMRLASDVLNQAIRNSSVTFTLTDAIFKGTKKDKWNYFGLEDDGKKIVQYTWNEATGTHEEKVLISAREGIVYNLYFKQNTPKSKLIEFHLECIPEGSEERAIAITTELAALNSVAVDDGGSAASPATAIAYRSDPSPKPEVITTKENVKIAVALVLDNSTSMTYRMKKNSSSGDSRNTIMRREAKKLIDQFADSGIDVCIIPFGNSANNPGSMQSSKLNKVSLKTQIDGITPPDNTGTNAGDGLRRAYYKILDYNSAVGAGEEVVNYIIILTDGNPTYYSVVDRNSTTYKTGTDSNLTLYSRSPYEYKGGGSDDTDGRAMGYVEEIGKNWIVKKPAVVNGKKKEISTFVIGFTGDSADINNAGLIAKHCNSTENYNDPNKKYYYTAGTSIELENTFKTITQTILQETWHIYGPY